MLLQGPRCVLAGDHLQLPPTIQSIEAEKKGLGKTLFERLAGLYGEDVMSMLTVQYRMHELIMNWSSKEFYNSKVVQLPFFFFFSFVGILALMIFFPNTCFIIFLELTTSRSSL